MPDESSTPANQVLTQQTIQAGLATAIAGLATLLFPGKVAQAVSIVAPFASLLIVWFANRWMKRDQADQAASEPTRQLKKLLAETEERLRVIDANAPERRQLQKQAAGLREAIYQVVVRGAEPTSPNT